MKKRLLAIALCLCTVFSIAACSSDDGKDEKEKTVGKLTLGEYKGLKVDASLKTVPKENVDKYVESVLNAFATKEDVKDTTVVLAKGDEVKLSYEAKVDGKAYDSMKSETMELTENGFYLEGLVDAIIGKNVGSEFEVTIKAPEKFTDATVAGKDIVFSVKLEAKVKTIIPELTDDFVKENYDYRELSTVDELLADIEKELYIQQIVDEIFPEIVDNAKAESYDSEEYDKMYQTELDYIEYYASYYGIDKDNYVKSLYGMTMEQFQENVKKSIEAYLKQKMVYEEIAKAENLEITDEIYNEKMMEFAEAAGCKTIEEFLKYYEGYYTEEDFRLTILAHLVDTFLYETVEFVDGYGLREEESTSGSKEENTSGTGEEATTGEDETTTAATK